MGKWIEVEQDVKVYVEDIGQGEPVVFIHGWPLSNTSFEGQISTIAFSHWMNEHITDSKLVTFEESGHGMNFDEKDKFNEELLKLLKQN